MGGEFVYLYFGHEVFIGQGHYLRRRTDHVQAVGIHHVAVGEAAKGEQVADGGRVAGFDRHNLAGVVDANGERASNWPAPL